MQHVWRQRFFHIYVHKMFYIIYECECECGCECEWCLCYFIPRWIKRCFISIHNFQAIYYSIDNGYANPSMFHGGLHGFHFMFSYSTAHNVQCSMWIVNMCLCAYMDVDVFCSWDFYLATNDVNIVSNRFSFSFVQFASFHLKLSSLSKWTSAFSIVHIVRCSKYCHGLYNPVKFMWCLLTKSYVSLGIGES